MLKKKIILYKDKFKNIHIISKYIHSRQKKKLLFQVLFFYFFILLTHTKNDNKHRNLLNSNIESTFKKYLFSLLFENNEILKYFSIIGGNIFDQPLL